MTIQYTRLINTLLIVQVYNYQIPLECFLIEILIEEMMPDKISLMYVGLSNSSHLVNVVALHYLAKKNIFPHLLLKIINCLHKRKSSIFFLISLYLMHSLTLSITSEGRF